MKKVDKFHRHELLDRCAMICDIIEYGVIGHPALTLSMAEDLVEAQTLMYKVYSKACDDHCKKCGKTALAKSVMPNKKKRMVCLNCFNDQKRKKKK